MTRSVTRPACSPQKSLHIRRLAVFWLLAFRVPEELTASLHHPAALIPFLQSADLVHLVHFVMAALVLALRIFTGVGRFQTSSWSVASSFCLQDMLAKVIALQFLRVVVIAQVSCAVRVRQISALLFFHQVAFRQFSVRHGNGRLSFSFASLSSSFFLYS